MTTAVCGPGTERSLIKLTVNCIVISHAQIENIGLSQEKRV